MNNIPPRPVLAKHAAVPENDMAAIVDHALYGGPRPNVTAPEVEQVLLHPTLQDHVRQKIREAFADILPQNAGFRRKSQTARFNRCVKAVRKTVKARKGSNKESAAIAICTKTILHKRGRTLKKYRKGRLLTQSKK